MTSTRIDWIARPGDHASTLGTQFTADPNMMGNDMEIIRMKDFDLSHMNGDDKIEIAGVELRSTNTSEHEGSSPV
jgi:hypothetical protein